MKQEELEMAASICAAKTLGRNEGKKNAAVNARAMYYCKECFKAGAAWQRNHVWHNMKLEEPQAYGEYEDCIYPEIPCLVRGQLSTGYGYGVRYWNIIEKVWDDEECDDFECNKDDIEEWAYLDDLTPTSFDDIIEENKDVLQRLKD